MKNKSVCAIDITDTGVFAVKARTAVDGVAIERALEYRLDFMPAQLHAINGGPHIVQILKDVGAQLGCTRAHVGIPSRHFFYQCVSLPIGEHQLSQTRVETHLEDHLRTKTSLPASHLLCEYEIVRASSGQVQIAVSVVPQNIQENYRKLFVNAGLYPISLGSSLRSLVSACGKQSKPMMALYVEPHAIQVKTIHDKHVYDTKRFTKSHISQPLLVQQLIEHMSGQWIDDLNSRGQAFQKVLLVGSPTLVKPVHGHLLAKTSYQVKRAGDIVAPFLSTDQPPHIHREQLDHFAGAISLAVQDL